MLAATAVVLDVDEDAGPLADLLGQEQVDEVLEGGKALALAPDERPERLLLVAFTDDVEAVRLAGLDLDEDVEIELRHELLEDLLRRGHGLGRDLGGLWALDVRGDARGRDFRQLLGGQRSLRRGPVVVLARAAPAAVGPWAAVSVAVETTSARAALGSAAAWPSGRRMP